MSWICCKCSRDNTSASFICTCGHGTLLCLGCFSYDNTCQPSIFLRITKSKSSTQDAKPAQPCHVRLASGSSSAAGM
ncbi:hypothetical protein BST61_g11035 [Cercospora zeina]